ASLYALPTFSGALYVSFICSTIFEIALTVEMLFIAFLYTSPRFCIVVLYVSFICLAFSEIELATEIFFLISLYIFFKLLKVFSSYHMFILSHPFCYQYCSDNSLL